LTAEQKRIEKELEDFRKNIFGDPAKKDSLDSIANANPQNIKAAKKAKKARKGRRKGSRSESVSSSRVQGAGSARVTVRRQRH
jgi:CHASE3 domain sensor protein